MMVALPAETCHSERDEQTNTQPFIVLY